MVNLVIVSGISVTSSTRGTRTPTKPTRGDRLNLLVAKFVITIGVAILWYASAVIDIVDQIVSAFIQAYMGVLFATRVIRCVILAFKR